MSPLIANIIIGILALTSAGLGLFFYLFVAAARKKAEEARTLQTNLEQYVNAYNDLNAHYQRAIESVQAAENASRAKSTFLATMSHEIRTPLNAVLGMTDVLNATPLNEEQKDCLLTIKKSGEALLAIIGNILDYSKIESGKLDLHPEMFNLSDLVGEIEQLFKHSAKSKGLMFNCQYEQSQTFRIFADRNRLRQVLVNLIGNAIKFTETGSITVQVTKEAVEPSPEDKAKGLTYHQIAFVVADTGMGIPEDQRQRIFEPFTQVDDAHTRTFGGTGLGLAIVKKILETMGGVIDVAPNHPRGTIFSVVFIAKTMVVAKPVTQPPFKIGGGISSGTTTLYKQPLAETFYSLNVLVVEDDPQNRKVIQLILQKMGQKPQFAVNGKEAIDWLQANPAPDVILMDVGMPVMDGMEATRRIRAGEAGEDKKDITIVALTAYAVTTDREKILSSGMNHYLSKPVQTDALRDVLTKIARAQKN